MVRERGAGGEREESECMVIEWERERRVSGERVMSERGVREDGVVSERRMGSEWEKRGAREREREGGSER